jgi:hypothetical protein
LCLLLFGWLDSVSNHPHLKNVISELPTLCYEVETAYISKANTILGLPECIVERFSIKSCAIFLS